MAFSKTGYLTTYVLLLWLSVSDAQEVETSTDVEDADGKTLGHLIRGGHTLADTLINGIIDGTYHIGQHIGQHISPGVPVGYHHIVSNPPLPLFGNLPGYNCGYGYGGCFPNTQFPGQFHPGLGLHRPGFEGTYASKPFSGIDREGSRDLEPVPRDDIPTDKLLSR